MSNELTTITRRDAASIVKQLPTEIRLECDKVFTLAKAVDDKAGDDLAALYRQQAIAIVAIAGNEEAIEKAGFDDFKTLAATIFNMEPQKATQFRKAAERFHGSEKFGNMWDWFTPGMLYEFRKVPDERITEDVGKGKIKPGMTLSAIRAYVSEVKSSEVITDGKTELMKTYDVHFSPDNCTHPCSLSYEEMLDAMRQRAREALNLDPSTVIETDRFGSFNPHVTITPEKGKPYDAKGVVLVFGTYTISAWYTPHKTPRIKKAGSPQDVMQAAMKLTPEQRAEFIRQLSQYNPEEDDE